MCVSHSYLHNYVAVLSRNWILLRTLILEKNTFNVWCTFCIFNNFYYRLISFSSLSLTFCHYSSVNRHSNKQQIVAWAHEPTLVSILATDNCTWRQHPNGQCLTAYTLLRGHAMALVIENEADRAQKHWFQGQTWFFLLRRNNSRFQVARQWLPTFNLELTNERRALVW